MTSGWSEHLNLRGHEAQITSLCWAPSSERFATGDMNGRVVVWNSSSGTVVAAAELRYPVIDMTWSPDSSSLAVSIQEGENYIVREDDFDIDPSIFFGLDDEDDGRTSSMGTGFGKPGLVERPDSAGVRILDGSNGLQIGSLPVAPGDWQTGAISWSQDRSRLFVSTDSGLERWHVFDAVREERIEMYGRFALRPDGKTIVTPGHYGLSVFDLESRELRELESECDEQSIATFTETGETIAVGCANGLVEIWRYQSDNAPVRRLEGHIGRVDQVSFSSDSRVLLSRAGHELRVWDTSDWELLSAHVLPTRADHESPAVLAPRGHRVAVVNGGAVLVLHLDLAVLQAVASRPTTVHYSNAKVVLLGDSGVGKSGLGLVLAGLGFRATESTHQRNVYRLSSAQTDGEPAERREVFLWDLAGQPGYRLLHQLHLADVVVALIVFDARTEDDPFSGVRYWARALDQAEGYRGAGNRRIQRVLVAARTDRGGTRASDGELRAVQHEFGLDSYVVTSALSDVGIETLRTKIEALIDWTAVTRVSSTELFDSVRRYLFEKRDDSRVLVALDDLREEFWKSRQELPVGNADEFAACLGRVEARGGVRRLSFGDLVVLKPEVVDAYASAIVNAARAGASGVGAIGERAVLNGEFEIPPEIRVSDSATERLVLIATVEDLLAHEVALREESNQGAQLVFPAAGRSRIPADPHLRPLCALAFAGALQHVWATLVVRLAHSDFFTLQDIGGDAAVFAAGERRFGIELMDQRDGSAIVNVTTLQPTADLDELFIDFVAKHLDRRAVPGTVERTDIAACASCGYAFPPDLISSIGPRSMMFCPRCGHKAITAEAPTEGKHGHLQLDALDASANEERGRLVNRMAAEGKAALKEFDVFLAHNSDDKPQVRRLAERLKDQGLNPWIDEEQIPPGRWFQDVIQSAVASVRTAAIVVGPHGLGPWQQLEIRSFLSEAVGAGLPVIPVLLPNVKDWPDDVPFLKELNGVVFKRSLDEEEPFRRLVWGITAD